MRQLDDSTRRSASSGAPMIGGFKGSLLTFCMIAAGVAAFGLLSGFKLGETLAVVEAMKMENVLRAERDATVGKILAKPGDSLAVDAVILEFA